MLEDWQPLDTAPKRGQRILVWDKASGVLIAAYIMGEWYCHEIRATLWPEFWQPLPPPPAETGPKESPH